MPNIIPLRELKNASKVSALCHSQDSPIFVTKNGVSDLVILTSDAYDRLVEPKVQRYVVDLPALEVAEPSSLKEYMAIRDSQPVYSISEIKKALKPIFDKYRVKKAILFGSYVNGNPTTRSDIDILVESDLKGLSFYGLLADAAGILRVPVDLIEKRQVEKGSDFEKEIDQTGVTIYG